MLFFTFPISAGGGKGMGESVKCKISNATSEVNSRCRYHDHLTIFQEIFLVTFV